MTSKYDDDEEVVPEKSTSPSTPREGLEDFLSNYLDQLPENDFS